MSVSLHLIYPLTHDMEATLDTGEGARLVSIEEIVPTLCRSLTVHSEIVVSEVALGELRRAYPWEELDLRLTYMGSDSYYRCVRFRKKERKTRFERMLA